MKYKYTIAQLEEMDSCKWLTDHERDVFDLYYRRGWAIDDIAAELYCSPGKIKKDLRNIREKTRCCDVDLM
jgi:DNA-directed RNA polymerase specialized sigma24 family protein